MDQPVVHIYISRLEGKLPIDRWNDLLELMPLSLRDKISNFRFWKDQHRALFGKLLLRRALADSGYSGVDLSDLTYTSYGKPRLGPPVNFNISHAGHYVGCAIGEGFRLGIDIEHVREIRFSDFERVMSPSQWSLIQNSADPLRSFFRLWTLKESVIKGNGKGLSLPLDKLETDFSTVRVEGIVWHLTEIVFDADHCAFLACDRPGVRMVLIPVSFYH